MKNIKQVIATEQDTDVWALAELLNQEQVAALMSSLLIQGKITKYELEK